ncbi:MAG: sulfite exporter TauE/SafE family protein [Bacteroidales bacterium]|nr:sulfite exporter TauE/SafE family protein [Bacteroidales bacterium]
MTIPEILILIIVGLFGGFIAGTLGVGGGIIIVPALVFILGLTQHQAQGTSLAMMLAPIGILAVANYYKSGYVNIKFAIILMLAFILGGYFGSLFAINLSDLWLKRIFGVLMMVVGVKMVLGK